MLVPILLLLLSLLILYGWQESRRHLRAVNSIPNRIHVNGSRGKSSVTRLIAAGLRAGGIKTIAKTTGSAPRIIEMDGRDQVIHRLRSASIGEQVKLTRHFARKKPEAMVIECMAVLPQYQWVSEQKMIKSTLSIITNVRPDHLPEMGPTMEDVANSLSNTIPFNGTLLTAEMDISGELKAVADKRNTTMEIVHDYDISDEYINRFPYIEHKENVALAVKACESVGVDKTIALEGMIHAKPDPGALVIRKLQFDKHINYSVNAMAANDPHSTKKIWNNIKGRFENKKVSVFLNTRDDRQSRTKQLLKLVLEEVKPSILFIRGNRIPAINETSMKLIKFRNSTEPKEVINSLSKLDHYLIFCIGNMVGWGETFITELREHSVND